MAGDRPGRNLARDGGRGYRRSELATRFSSGRKPNSGGRELLVEPWELMEERRQVLARSFLPFETQEIVAEGKDRTSPAWDG